MFYKCINNICKESAFSFFSAVKVRSVICLVTYYITGRTQTEGFTQHTTVENMMVDSWTDQRHFRMRLSSLNGTELSLT